MGRLRSIKVLCIINFTFWELFGLNNKVVSSGVIIGFTIFLFFTILISIKQNQVLWGFVVFNIMSIRLIITNYYKLGLGNIEKHSFTKMKNKELLYYISLVLFTLPAYSGFIYFLITFKKNPLINNSYISVHSVLIFLFVGALILDIIYFFVRKKNKSFLRYDN